MLDWLDTVPDMRVAGVQRVHGVQRQKTAAEPCTPAGVQPCAPVCMHTPAHQCTPMGVQLNVAENRDSTPCTPCTPLAWHSLTTRGGEIGRWATLLMAREAMSEPAAISPARWREVLADAHRFLAGWGEQALAFGWDEADLFAVPPGPERWGRAGLVALLRGRIVAAMTDQAITIANRIGEPNRYRRSEIVGHVLLWEPQAYADSASVGAPRQ